MNFKKALEPIKKTRMMLFFRMVQRFFITLAVKIFVFPINHPRFKSLAIGSAVVLSKLEASLLKEVQEEAKICMAMAERWQMSAKKRLFLVYKVQKALGSKDDQNKG